MDLRNPDAHAEAAANAILLHPNDNVVVARVAIKVGETVRLPGESMTADDDIDVGHKVARADLAVGDTVMKYGAPIGSVTARISRGAHVHVHNMESNYLATHTRDAVHQCGADR